MKLKEYLYEKQDRRGRVEGDEKLDKVKVQNLRRYKGKKSLRLQKGNEMKILRRY